jgi:hypothetical protein
MVENISPAKVQNPTSDGRQIDPLEGCDWWLPLLRLYFWLVRW